MPPVTVTIKIDKLDRAKKVYPLRLLLHTANGKKKKAEASIPESVALPDQVADPKSFRETLLKTATPSDNLRTIGAHLYKLLGAGKVGETWERLRQTQQPVRTFLEIEDRDLALLPWELACKGMDWLATNPTNTFIRRITYSPPGIHIAPMSWPIRALIVSGAYKDDEAVAADDEIFQIEDALRPVNHIIDLEICRQESIENMLKLYGVFKPHIFHFIGHGGMTSTKEARLAFDLPAGKRSKFNNAELKRESWTAQTIYTNLQARQWVPRLAFINSCRSNALGDPVVNQTSSWSIGDAFRDLKALAVLTMQADIRGILAGILAGRFYKGIAEGEPLDIALARARELVITKSNIKSRDWALASLTVSMPPEEVLPIEVKVDNTRSQKIAKCFEHMKTFVDRTDDRRKFIQAFNPILTELPKQHLVVVRGSAAAGKTWLADWCMRAYAWQNHNIRYVEIADLNSKNWFDVLLQIRDGDTIKGANSLIKGPLREDAFYKFNWELEQRVKGLEPQDPWAGQIVPSRKVEAEPNTWPEKFVEKTLASFEEALINVAEVDNPLIIVLDHFTSKTAALPDTEMYNFLIPKFIEHIAEGKLTQTIAPNQIRSVKMVLVLTNEEFEDYQIGNMLTNYQDIELGEISPDKYCELAVEFLRYCDLNVSVGELEGIIQRLSKLVTKPWKPAQLKKLYESVTGG